MLTEQVTGDGPLPQSANIGSGSVEKVSITDQKNCCPGCGGPLSRGTYDAVEGARYRWCLSCGEGPIKFPDPSWGDPIFYRRGS